MTGVLIQRGNLNTDVEGRPCEDAGRRLWGSQFLLFKPPSLWPFVTAASAKEYNIHFHARERHGSLGRSMCKETRESLAGVAVRHRVLLWTQARCFTFLRPVSSSVKCGWYRLSHRAVVKIKGGNACEILATRSGLNTSDSALTASQAFDLDRTWI